MINHLVVISDRMGAQDKVASPEIEAQVLSVMLVGAVIRLLSSATSERNCDSTLESLAAF
jgi:hypothetical protein